jgi:putative GTP pyrophosphokinase
MNEPPADRRELSQFLERHDYQVAIEGIRETLRGHLIENLGGDWEKIHTDLRMYTINCRCKRVPRTLEKYDTLANDHPINAKNFFEYMPDLVGARLVVVDPGDLFNLAEKVRAGCLSPVFEPPGDAFKWPRRVRHGRFSMYDTESFKKAGYHIEEEATGYCSVHFVFRTGERFFSSECPSQNRKCLRELSEAGTIPMTRWRVEVQVRTLMDEAWGETDHLVRYEDQDLRNDPDITRQFTALSGYLQAANYHVSLIRQMAKAQALKRKEAQ